MKINKVLLGLFVGVLALVGGAATAQTTFREIGPSNVGGHVSSLVVDQRDTNHTTVFAGAIAGGLFMMSDNATLLNRLYAGREASLAENHRIWHQVPCEINLPITSMVQGPDNTIYIGTGDNTYQVGSSFGRMSVLGKGIYRYKPDEGTFTLVAGTKPDGVNHSFAAVKHVGCIERNGKFYFYAVTGTGIFRWVIDSSHPWESATPVNVFAGEVDDFIMVNARRVAYFSVGNQLYKIGDVTANAINPVNISASNAAFGSPNAGIKLASAPTAPDHLYAMVIKDNGTMEALYLTTNEQDWVTLTTSTITPFASGAGSQCGTMTVDPLNPKRIYIGGTTIWAGQGYVEGSYFQWTKSSYYESELNSGDYMATVFSSPMFVHSGIHQIVWTWQGSAVKYYIATDGGVFTTTSFNNYDNENSGLNNVQMNGIAVSPDGTVTGGAVSNAIVMVDGRLGHNAVPTEATWYDVDNSGLNHIANIVFSDNGGKTAASMFQQVKPSSRRLIMVSNDVGNYGRAYADYLDYYNNTQTWTQGSAFISNKNAYGGSNTLGNIYLWETTNDHIFNDSIKNYQLDTLGYIFRKFNGVYDTVWIGIEGMTTGARFVRDANGRITDTIAVGTGHGPSFQILSQDKTMIVSRANSEYPFEYTFTKNQLAGDAFNVKNPIQARALIVARDSNDPNCWTVQMSLRATDFTKVWNMQEAYDREGYDYGGLCLWYPIFEIRTAANAVGGAHSEKGLRPRGLAMSADGTKVFVAVQDILTHESMIVRINGFENVNYNVRNDSATHRKADYPRLYDQLSGLRINTSTMLTFDTLRVNGNMWIPRRVSSILADTNAGAERLIVTFEDYDENFANVGIINNCKESNWSLVEKPITDNANIPAYCSMVEKTTGDVYVGTSDGVFILSGSTTWNAYNNLKGIPVTSMVQQQGNLKVVHNLSHNGINPLNYVFAKTKWPNAMYFGTYGRGIFIDTKYVVDMENEIVDSADFIEPVGIPTVYNTSMGSVKVFPNPVYGEANLTITSDVAANGIVRIYDLNGRCVAERRLGLVNEGESTYSISTEGLTKGMYLVNVIIGGYTSATKMMVR